MVIGINEGNRIIGGRPLLQQVVLVRMITYERSTLHEQRKVYWSRRSPAKISVAVMDLRGKLVMESIVESKAATILEFFAGLSLKPLLPGRGYSPDHSWISTSDPSSKPSCQPGRG